MAGSLGLSIEQRGLQQLGRLMKAEEDGKILRKELQGALKAAVAPAVAEVKAGAMSVKREMSVVKWHAPLKESQVSLGAAIANGISTSVRMSGRTAGVAVKATRKGMPRNFKHAPKRFNQKSFRHPVFGQDVWVDQVGAPNFFDGPLQARKAQYREAIVAVMAAMGARLAARS